MAMPMLLCIGSTLILYRMYKKNSWVISNFL
jgi:hypothetical protein